MMIEPLSGLSSPMSVFRNTDLPVPDGPSSTDTSPGGSVSVTSPQIDLAAERFGQVVDCNLNPHAQTPSAPHGRRAVSGHP